MAYFVALWKLLYHSKYFVKYVTYAFLFLLLCIVLHLWSIRYNIDYSNIPSNRKYPYNNSYDGPKHILVWQHYYMMTNRKGKQKFPDLQCKINNCIFTEDKHLLGDDYSRFDAILFSESILKKQAIRPERRSLSQIYIFSTIESAYYTPACELHNDNFFNWTFTYRLDSDIPWPYFIVRNATRDIVAPSVQVNWTISKSPITKGIKQILQHKTKAVAWLVSHCEADSLRDDYVSRLQDHLYHYSLKIDVYGRCSGRTCDDGDCEEMFTRDYYFYLAFENSFSVDYVSEKVLHGYNNYVVPIVYGGANYTRFLPPGSYLNARELHPYNLAYLIHEAIKHPSKYKAYFKWTNSYTFDSDVIGHHPLCNLCEALNSKKAKRRRTYKKFRIWWNGLNGMKWCLPQEYWNETSIVNLDGKHIFDTY
ncbi:unnamed protein product [Chrysodeixis includens]|uniref:Fucosyltransferase n=1 Tax=Chrysodeixis includens TaxID=689277 RepID=A0A9P0BPY8_CHRIL|nr:unnamed protein product [Chrysodeixis includens]